MNKPPRIIYVSKKDFDLEKSKMETYNKSIKKLEYTDSIEENVINLIKLSIFKYNDSIQLLKDTLEYLRYIPVPDSSIIESDIVSGVGWDDKMKDYLLKKYNPVEYEVYTKLEDFIID